MAHHVPSSQFDFRQIIQPGDHVIWPQGTGEPTGLSAALLRQSGDIPAPTLVLGMLTTKTLDLLPQANVQLLCLNGAANTRHAVAKSRNRVIPAHLSAIPGLLNERRIPVDVALVRARPTQDPNVLSLGVMVDFVHEMIAAARVVVVELDERLPLTGDDALVELRRFTHVTLADGPEPMLPDPIPSEVDQQVARHVAALIPDRATVQLGVGGIPTAVCAELRHHQDLGLHSGVIPDAVVPLLEAGVVNNRFKGLDDGKTVTGGLFGTRRLFDFAHANPEVMMRRAVHTHASRTLSNLRNLYTINSTVEIDLSGQCNSEVAGKSYVGAVGGQVDYVRGSRLSEGGRSIMAFPSTTPDGAHSRVVASLGAHPVTTARSDIDIVVTEFGAADLWGLDLHARARRLIGIAHPKFREHLEAEFTKNYGPAA